MDKNNCTLSLNDFVLLMFATLAKNSKLNDYCRKIIIILQNYR